MECKECKNLFEYFPGEIDAYKGFQTPPPACCPLCRQKRRMAFRNEKKLYHNKSYASGRQIIALYPPDSPFKIIDQDEWWNDSFDATEFGRDFDFSKPFFTQLKELQRDVPRWSRIFLNCVNSDFTNNCANTNNSYLAFSCHDSGDLYYSVRVNRCQNCLDCYNIAACEYCSNSLDCERCYGVHYSQSAENCHDCLFVFDCHSCSDCLLCAGIRNGKYMILNKKYSKEDYEKYREDFIQKIWKDENYGHNLLENLKRQIFHRNIQIVNSENCSGNFIVNSRNVIHAFNTTNSEDCINIYNSDRLKNCYDNYHNDKSELCLECDTAYEVYNSKFSTYFVGCKNVEYLDQCFFLENCFGCIGLKRAKNTILNKKYSEADYKIMLNKIRDHMRKTGEYGQPIPATMSAFAYNETLAFESHSMSKQDAESKGYFWHEDTSDAKYFGKPYVIPGDPKGIDESICDKILTCEVTGKNYKIIPQEYKFYQKWHLPLPKKCPDQRYKDLQKLRNPEELRKTKCHLCGKDIETTYPGNTPYKIICEDCYLKQAY